MEGPLPRCDPRRDLRRDRRLDRGLPRRDRVAIGVDRKLDRDAIGGSIGTFPWCDQRLDRDLPRPDLLRDPI